MIFETHIPGSELGKHIETLIYFKDFMPDHTRERVIPTGHIYIIFELDGIKRSTFDNETLKPNGEFTEVWVSGAHKNYITISAHERSEMFVVQFKPFGAHPFFHIPLSEISSCIFHAKELFGQKILAVRQKLMQTNGVQQKFNLALNWLETRYDRNDHPRRFS
jgi:hypothetical protein